MGRHQRMRRAALAAMLAMTAVTGLWAQRVYQPLGRGVVTSNDGQGVLVSWRHLAQEPEDATYNVYVNGTKVNASPLTKTNFRTTTAVVPTGASVAVTAVSGGQESALSQPWRVKAWSWNNVVADIPFETKVLTPDDYRVKYVWPADLDGDGEYEYVVDRLSTTDISTRSHKLQAYDRNGTCLWTVDLGPNVNIDAGQNDMVVAYDIDCDGRAEVIIRSSDGTRFWDQENDTFGTYVFGKTTPDIDGDGVTDYWSSTTRNAPFYASVIDGLTGAEKCSAELKYEEVTDGTDSWTRTNRSDYMGEGYSFMEGHFGIGYLDGIHPSVLMECQDRTTDGNHHTYVFVFNYDFDGGTAQNWHHAATATGKGATFHQIRIADMDGDGRDELVQGGYWLNPLSGKYQSSGIAHGDRFRVSDINPERPGMEVYAIQQNQLLGQVLYDAASGEHIKEWYLASTGDVGRGECMDVDLTHKGYEIYSTMANLYSCEGDVIKEGDTDYPFEGIWWDGLLDREVLGSHGGSGWNTNVMINKYGGNRLIQISKESNYAVHSCTANRPLFVGDIMGDWREEVILAKQSDSSSTGFVVYSTAAETDYSFYCLQQDPHYRGDCTTRGYYQSPNTGFYLGGDMPLPPLPPMMTTDVSYASGSWTSALADGRSLMFSLEGQNSATIDINGTVAPDTVFWMNPLGHDYTFGGTGTIGGTTEIWKSQQGTVTLNNDITSTGTTYVSEGVLEVNGSVSGAVELRSRGTLQGNATLSGPLTLEGALNYEGGRLRPGRGGNGSIGVITLNGTLDIAHRLYMEMDVTAQSEPAADLIQVNGDVKAQAAAIFTIVADDGSVMPGRYKLLSYTGTFEGSMDNFSVKGLTGLSYALVQQNQAIWLQVNEQRAAADGVSWTGAESGEWNYSQANFLLDGEATEFVANDTIAFDDSAVNVSIAVPELMPTGGVTFSNETVTYTLSGNGGLSGAGGLTKVGDGRLVLQTTKSDYTGETVINGGTVVVKELANGGTASSIGAASSDASNLQIGRAVLVVDNVSAATDRGLTLTDSATIQNASGSLTLQGIVKGTGMLTKAGGGQLSLTYGANPWSGGTTLKAGTLAMGAWNTTFGKAGSPLHVTGTSAIRIFDNNSTSAVPVLNNAITVDDGKVLTIYGGSRCKVGGSLSGGGTVKITFPYVRGDFYANLTDFSGLLENTSGQMRLTSAMNMEQGTYQPDAGVYTAGVKSQSGSETSMTHKIGALQGQASDASFGTGIWNVGYLGTDTEFAGTFNSSATLNKYGDGQLALSGASAAPVNVYAGVLSLNNADAATTTGLVTVYTGGTVLGAGMAASVTVNQGGTLGAGKPASLTVGTLTLTGNLTVRSGANIRVRGRATSRVDAFDVAGRVTLTSPHFVMERLSADWKADTDYKVFTGTGTITLTGTPTFEPEIPVAGCVWDYSSLASDGILRIVADPVGIRSVEADGKTGEIYDVSGRKAADMSRHGVYVVNGKKVVK